MAGYCGFSKSNNAIEAENRGLMTASQLAKALKCKSAAIKARLVPKEWHHTSKCFNCTDYYYEPALLAVVGLFDAGHFDDEELSAAQAKLAALRAHGKAQIGGEWEGCKVAWLEWSGIPGCTSRRNRPRAEECEATSCRVEWKGAAMLTITESGGRQFRKKIDTRGLKVTLDDGTLLIGGWKRPEESLQEAVARA